MANENRAQIIIDGNVGPLREKLREVGQQMEAFGSQAGNSFGKLSAPLDMLRGKFVALTAILAGGALFGVAVQEATKFSEASIQLGKALGVSATQASGWIGTLEDAGVTTEEFASASKGLLRQVRENEDGLHKMGLATRDAAGNLRPMNELVLDAVSLVNGYSEGTSRNAAANAVFGKSVDASSKLLRINVDAVKENTAFQRELGLVVGQEQVDAFNAFDNSMDRSALVIKALKNTVGQALMPVLTTLGEWFSAIGPAAVTVLRGAIGGLVSLFHGLRNAVVIAFEVINATVITAAEPLRALAAAFVKLLQGDFKGAAAELTAVPQRMSAAWSTAWQNILASSTDARDKIAALFLDGPDAAAPGTGKNFDTGNKPGKAIKAPAESSMLAVYELQVAELKRLAAVEREGREYSKVEELAYWRAVLENVRLSSADRVSILKKASMLEVDIARAGLQQRRALENEAQAQGEAMALGRVDAARATARVELDLGQITRAEFLQLDMRYEEQRYAIQRAAMQQRLQMLAEDPTTDPVARARLLGQLAQLEQQHETRMIEMRGGLKKGDGPDLFDGMAGNMTQNLNAMLMGAQTWANGMAGIFGNVRDAFMDAVVNKPFQEYIASQARLLAFKMGMLSKEEAAQMIASGKILGVKGAETAGVGGLNATQAGTGAFAALAAIPVVGPALAAVAGPAMFALVMAMVSRGMSGNKSARGGYDIPAGINPMTQLHEEEMVLPAPLANAVRAMTGGQVGSGGAGGGGGDVHVQISGTSVGDWVMVHRNELKKGIARALRDSHGRWEK